MKKHERLKWTSVAVSILMLVGMLTVAVSAISLNETGPDAQGVMVYSFPADAQPDDAHSGPTPNNGDPYGTPYAKYEFSTSSDLCTKRRLGKTSSS
jgi:hypothetical protein